MKIECLGIDFSICRVSSAAGIDFERAYTFYAKTDAEISLVCESGHVPADAVNIEAGWRAFRLSGILEFCLVGILSKITTILADNHISLFAVSTYNTDYILVKEELFDSAISLLRDNGYEISQSNGL